MRCNLVVFLGEKLAAFAPGLREGKRQTEDAVDRAEGCFGRTVPELAEA